MTPHTHPALLSELARITNAHRLTRKLLVCQSPAQGRELLHALAAGGVPWIGWETTTLRQLALDLVALDLARSATTLTDEFDTLSLMDQAIDAVQERGAAGPFGNVASAAGFRDAIRHAVLALRDAGIDADQVDLRRGDHDLKLGALAEFLREYEARLRERRQIDTAGLLHRATAAIRTGRAELPAAQIYLLPGHTLRGRTGEFVRLLLDAGPGGEVLATDAVIGLPVPPARLWAETAAAPGPLSRLHDPLSRSPAPLAPPEGAPRDTGPANGTQAKSGSLTAQPADPLRDATPEPPFGFFAAATPADEIREILRRTVARGIPWDQVEIIATDALTYSATLDGIARRLGIPVTYASGLDNRRTRVGRAVDTYFRWISEGFPADLLRGMLEAGDLDPPAGAADLGGAALSRRLRRLRIGWGHERYLEVLDRALVAARMPAAADGERDAEEAAAANARELRELTALRNLIAPILAATPRLPSRARTAPARTSPAAIASGLLVFLEYVPTGDLVENNARRMIGDRLKRACAVLTRETGWEAAIGILRSRLETRVAPSTGGGQAPWTSTGGRLHLSDLTTGGLACRPYTFVVGLDAGRVAGGGGTDPILTDSDRLRLGRRTGAAASAAAVSASQEMLSPQAQGASLSATEISPLPTTSDRIQESRHEVAALLARLRGEITLSYSAWDATEGRAISPAPELLQALRLRERSDLLTYEDLRAALGQLACALPRASGSVDATDVWLAALSTGTVLRRGERAVRTAFPDLDRGFHAQTRRAGDELTEYHGLVTPSPELDPLADSGTVFSATRLEALGTCPRRFFYHYVLGVRPTQDPEWDPEQWLDALERGSLLHTVYEEALAGAREAAFDFNASEFEEMTLGILAREIDRAAARQPAPSQAVFLAQVESLHEDTRSFVELIRAQQPEWLALEERFGPEARAVTLQIGGAAVRVRGAIDRVDQVAPGVLRIIDYKTGSARRYRPTRPFHGGRRIQHILYMLAAEQLFDARVEALEYHFPTRRSQNQVVRYEAAQLHRGPEVLRTLFDIAAAGQFIATEDTSDCTYCNFAEICRATTNDYGKTSCQVAEWSREKGLRLPEYQRLVELRGIDD